MTALTTKERDALRKITSVVEMYVKQTREFIEANNIEGATASRFVSEHTLCVVHHVSRSAIKSLLKKGHLEMRQTDGFGPEITVTGELR